MLKLFQAVHVAGSQPDYSNDDLQGDDQDGFCWICPVDHLPPLHALLQAAQVQLGSIVRGVKIQPLPDPRVTIFLSSEYDALIGTWAEQAKEDEPTEEVTP